MACFSPNDFHRNKRTLIVAHPEYDWRITFTNTKTAKEAHWRLRHMADMIGLEVGPADVQWALGLDGITVTEQ